MAYLFKGSAHQENMPIVHVHMWKGVTPEQARHLVREITGVFEDMGIPARAVEVLVHEVPKTHWGLGGVPASECLPDEGP